MNNGLTPFPSDMQSVSGQAGLFSVPGMMNEPGFWQQATEIDFFQDDHIAVTPTEVPFWNGFGAAVSDVAKTFGLNLVSLFRP